jgi:hypothetical protein
MGLTAPFAAKAKTKSRVDGFYTMDRKGTKHVLLAVERQVRTAPSWPGSWAKSSLF